MNIFSSSGVQLSKRSLTKVKSDAKIGKMGTLLQMSLLPSIIESPNEDKLHSIKEFPMEDTLHSIKETPMEGKKS